MATAAVQWQLTDDGHDSLINRIDVCGGAAKRYDPSPVGFRLPTNLWKVQVPGHLLGELWGDSASAPGQ